jgi:hypothetical protein
MAYYQPGRYVVQVVDQGFGNSKQKLTPYFCLTIRPIARVITADEHEALPDSYERYIMLYLTDKTVDNVIARLRRLGFAGASFSQLDPANDKYHSFEGIEIMATCEHEQIGDKTYERWRLPLGGSPSFHEAEAGITRKLDARFGKVLKSTARSVKKEEAAVAAGDARHSLPF